MPRSDDALKCQRCKKAVPYTGFIKCDGCSKGYHDQCLGIDFPTARVWFGPCCQAGKLTYRAVILTELLRVGLEGATSKDISTTAADMRSAAFTAAYSSVSAELTHLCRGDYNKQDDDRPLVERFCAEDGSSKYRLTPEAPATSQLTASEHAWASCPPSPEQSPEQSPDHPPGTSTGGPAAEGSPGPFGPLAAKPSQVQNALSSVRRTECINLISDTESDSDDNHTQPAALTEPGHQAVVRTGGQSPQQAVNASAHEVEQVQQAAPVQPAPVNQEPASDQARPAAAAAAAAAVCKTETVHAAHSLAPMEDAGAGAAAMLGEAEAGKFAQSPAPVQPAGAAAAAAASGEAEGSRTVQSPVPVQAAAPPPPTPAPALSEPPNINDGHDSLMQDVDWEAPSIADAYARQHAHDRLDSGPHQESSSPTRHDAADDVSQPGLASEVNDDFMQQQSEAEAQLQHANDGNHQRIQASEAEEHANKQDGEASEAAGLQQALVRDIQHKKFADQAMACHNRQRQAPQPLSLDEGPQASHISPQQLTCVHESAPAPAPGSGSVSGDSQARGKRKRAANAWVANTRQKVVARLYVSVPELVKYVSYYLIGRWVWESLMA